MTLRAQPDPQRRAIEVESARREQILRSLAARSDVKGLLELALRQLRDLTDTLLEAADRCDPRKRASEELAARVRRAYEQGVSVDALCERFGQNGRARSRATIYRLLQVSRLRETNPRLNSTVAEASSEGAAAGAPTGGRKAAGRSPGETSNAE
jgi:hypothetical protein